MGMSIGNNYGGKVEVCGAVAVSHIEQPVMVIEHSELTPKLQIPAGLTMFSKSLKEKLLTPVVFRQKDMMNIHWKKVPDAAQYAVELYKVVMPSTKKRYEPYYMKTILADRDTCFTSLSGLLGNGFVVVVSAEDRSGKVIAQARGIMDYGEPDDWE